MAATTNVQVIIDAKDNASHVLKSFDNNASKVAKNFELNFVGAGLAATGALVAIGKSISFGATVAANTETARQGFKTLLNSAEAADEAIAMVRRDAATTPFEISGLTQANLLLTQVTKNAPRSEAVLLNVGKALAAAGKGQAELDRVILNLQQIGNTGKITEMDIKQFGFAGINILELLADYYGTTKEAAAEMIKNSKDGFADLEGAFAKAGAEGGKFGKAFTEQAGTFNQLVSNLKDNVSIMASELIIKSGAFDVIKNAMTKVIEVLSIITPKIIAFIEVIKNNQIYIGILAGLIGGLLVAAIAGFIAIISPIIGTLALIVGAFMAVGAIIGVVIRYFDQLKPILIGVGVALLAFAVTQIPALIAAFGGLVVSVVSGASAMIISLLPILGPFLLIGAAVALLYAAWTNNWGGIQEKVQVVVDWFTGVAWPAIQSFFMYIYNLIMFFVAIWQLEFAIIQDIVTALFNWFWSWAGPTILAFFELVKNNIQLFVEGWKYNFMVIKTTVETVVNWFMTYVYPTLATVFGWIVEKVNWLKEQFDAAMTAIRNAVEGTINFVRGLIDNFKPKIDIGINLPNVEEAWNNLKDRARKIGIPGFQTGGVVPGPIGSPALAVVHGGETINPVGRTSEVSGGGSTFNVYVGMYAGTETEKRNIARDLYSALVQVAQSQNKTVSELMGDR